MKNKLRDMSIAGLMLALTWVLPFITTLNIPSIAKRISPMHIPVFLCAFLCDGFWAPFIGLIAPILRSVTVGMPVLFPNAIAMAFELCAYGISALLLRRCFKENLCGTYLTLISSMLIGRVIYGIAAAILYGFAALPFTFDIFILQAFVNGLPGIICHLLIIPPIVTAARRVMKSERVDA